MSVLMKIKILRKENNHFGLGKLLRKLKNFAVPDGTFRESKRPHKLAYNALMSEILDSKPANVG